MSILKLFKHFRPFHNIADHAERTVRSIDYAPVATLSECLTARRPAITEMMAPGIPLPPGPLLFPEFANPTVVDQHKLVAPNPVRVYVASAPDIIVSGRSIAGTKTCVFDLNPTEPSYVASYMREGVVEFTGDFSLDSKTERCVDGCTALITHWNSNTYGHWLLECLPKLFLLHTLRHHLPDLKIAVSNAISRDITRWAAFLLPDVPLVTFDDQHEYLRCDRVIFPGRLSDAGYFFHPAMNDSISSIRKTAG